MNKSTTIQNVNKCYVDISRHFALMYELGTYVRTIESLIFMVDSPLVVEKAKNRERCRRQENTTEKNFTARENMEE